MTSPRDDQQLAIRHKKPPLITHSRKVNNSVANLNHQLQKH